MEITERVFKSTEFVGFVVFFLAATSYLFVACIVKDFCTIEVFIAWGTMVLGALTNLGWVRGKNKKIVMDLAAKKMSIGGDTE